MAQIIDMPKLSDTMTVGTLVKWLKNEGDAVQTGDMLAEVETDKATMELESFFDGTLLKQFVAAGAEVAIGDPLCAVGEPGEKVEAPAKEAPSATADSGSGRGKQNDAGSAATPTCGYGRQHSRSGPSQIGGTRITPLRAFRFTRAGRRTRDARQDLAARAKNRRRTRC